MILRDPWAEAIWEKEGFALKGKAASRWLAYYMGMRARVFDRWLEDRLAAQPDAVVVQIGCGMDSRVCRVRHEGHLWFDIDFPDVVRQRKRHYEEGGGYAMIASDARDTGYLARLPRRNALVIMEGVSMYLRRQELIKLLTELDRHFAGSMAKKIYRLYEFSSPKA